MEWNVIRRALISEAMSKYVMSQTKKKNIEILKQQGRAKSI